MSFANLWPIIASAPKRATPERLRQTKAALAILLLLPFASFGDFEYGEFVVKNARSFHYTAFDVVSSAGGSQTFSPTSYDSLYSFYATTKIGLRVDVKASTTSNRLLVPAYYKIFSDAAQISRVTITNSVFASTNGVNLGVSVLYFPNVSAIYTTCAYLYVSGYRGTGVVDIYENNNIHCVNFVFSSLVADVLSSTNTVFRQLLIANLSSISSSVQNIDASVSGLQSTMQQGYDDIVDALIGDYPEIQESLRKGDSRAVDVRTSIKSQLQAWRNQATQQLNDWKSDLKSDLQAWKTSDETGILNIRQHIQDVTSAVDSMKNQFVTTDPQGNPVSFSAFTTNFVTVPITNVVTQSGNEISSNIQHAASIIDDRLYDLYDRFYNDAVKYDADGLAVRIVHPTDGDNHVLVKDDAVLRALEDGVTFTSPELTVIADSWASFLNGYSTTNSLDWEPWFSKWVPFSDVVTNYYAEFNASAPASEIAADFLERGFDGERYSALPWFERVEVLLAMIADVRSNSVEVADIQDAMEEQVTNFQTLSTNVVSVSSDVVGLFQYVQRFSTSLQSVFGDSAAPLTGDYVLLPAGHWIGDTPLVLRVNPTIQNFCRLIMQCIWYLGFLVLLWVVVNWVWSKVVAVLRWLWSMFDV